MTPLLTTLLWHDEFDQPVGTGPDPRKWVHDLGDNGWGNKELQTYTNARENSEVVDDPAASGGRALVLRAVRTPAGGYTSARLKTHGTYAATHGRIEARLKLPQGQGIWPAFWMLGENINEVPWPACGEIDIMELVGHLPGTLYGTLHGPGYSGAHGLTQSLVLPDGAVFAEAYHVFAVDWRPGRIDWLLDGQVYRSLTPADLPAGAPWVFDHARFFLLLNLAVGGAWPGYPDATTQLPQEYRVDYVRVYRLD
ncbi:Beta-glucanase precursor [Lacunisphaera limnophila]|uniref:Beta-glucanase n=1 Tax=Lacunisphaera limnophila TaxID=1838286 RepID=A0A1D8ATZ6_9BACT|nr:glycoside hydrolase family 16 protein [Lacunisphaera limnophila]AOS44357.1 Beta-glucanase precursor [Lacunisphaera limnophila]